MTIPVVVLTAHADAQIRADEGGANAFLAKPFQPQNLRDAVLALIG